MMTGSKVILRRSMLAALLMAAALTPSVAVLATVERSSAPPATLAPDPTPTGSIELPARSALVRPEPSPNPFRTRIVVVEWKIKKGREAEFLDYWSTRSTIPDRSGLIGEFLSGVEDRDRFPWINWSLDDRWTTFYNVGLWRDSLDFEGQVGRFIDNSRPPQDFEAARRTRVFLAPERWRVGATALPVSDPQGVR
jgi:hypothetical protein